MFKVFAQFLLVAFLERRGDLAVDLIDLFVEGPELLLGVFKISVELFPVFFHRFETRGNPVQLAAAADLLRLLVHFRRRFAHMLDRVVDHAKPEKGANGALHTLALRRQRDIRFDEAQRPVAVGEKDFTQFGRKLVVDL